MKFWSALVFAMTVACFSTGAAMAADSVHEFKAKSIEGKDVDLSEYKGKVLLIVNVASECGLTPQYEQLQALHEKYAEKGLVVIGFPCNQFGGQEPGTEKDIKKFCSENYKVTFPMMSKVEVNGDGQTALYKYLKSQDPGFDYLAEDKDRAAKKQKISWNFEKFVVGKDGKVVGRVSPRTSPDDAEVVALIDAELKK